MLMPSEKEPPAKGRAPNPSNIPPPLTVSGGVVQRSGTSETSCGWLWGDLEEGVLIWILILENYFVQIGLASFVLLSRSVTSFMSRKSYIFKFLHWQSRRLYQDSGTSGIEYHHEFNSFATKY